MKMIKQRLMGLALVVISVLMLLLASTGETLEDRDVTAVLITLPLGVFMMVTKQYVLYDGEGPVEEENEQPGDTAPRTHSKKGVPKWDEKEL